MQKTVIVGMSGGVDSSVAALLLKKEGYRVIGLFMKNWEETDEEGRCTSSYDFEDVAKVCAQIDIPYYTVNFVEEYQTKVFSEFLEELGKGLTPNPDILCNREIKFKVFLQKARELGADFVATGHYCRTDAEGRLLKGLDPDKDQSYFLHAVEPGALQNVLFPIGHLRKTEVRSLAKKEGLATSEKKDSTGICFIGKRNFKPFLAKYIGYTPGPFETLSGQMVGEHDGAAFYTIGQRKGMGLGGEGEPWYVVGKDEKRNVVFVERGENHPALYRSCLEAKSLTWIKEPPPNIPYRCTAKIRYRQTDQSCVIEKILDGTANVLFDVSQRAITPGQSIAFYQGELCLGGGIIK